MFTSTSTITARTFTAISIVAVMLAGWQLFTPKTAEAQAVTEPTYEFSLTKKFSDVYPAGYTAAQFSFHIEGTSATGTAVNETVNLNHSTDDTATANIDLPIGTYTLTEEGPASFVPGEWTVQWSGYGCQNANSPSLSTIMTVSDDTTGNVCRADNQWRHGKVTVEKKFVGTSTAPENFDFTVTQGSNLRYDGPFDTDGINDNITIAIGDYIVTEAIYPDYVASYSDGCTGIMVQGGSATCIITNTYKDDGSGGGGGNNDNETGILVVKKIIIGTTTVPTDNFSFSYTGASGTTTFDVSGINNLTVATGTYSVTESLATGYTTTYNNCTDVIILSNATSTCIITNTLKDNSTGGGGGGGNNNDDYRLQGYVWHDSNEDGVWNENEDPLEGWTVHLTNGSTSRSTDTDTDGYYSFFVEAGVWTLSETVMSEWSQTHPLPTNYEVTVPEAQLTLHFPFNYLFTIAHAETFTVSGDFNFGNVFKGGQGGGGSSSSGTRTDRNNGDGSGATNNVPEPTPLVLGEQVSVVPYGGAHTGAGGTSPTQSSLPELLITATMLTLVLLTSRKSI